MVNELKANQQGLFSPVLAFDMGGTRIKAGLVSGATVSSLTTTMVEESHGVEGVVAQMLALGRQLLERHEVERIGISVRGIVDPHAGKVLDLGGPLASLVGYPLAEAVTSKFGYPTAVENDARMYTLGELVHGSGQGYQNLVCLTLGTGIGSGVALGRHVLRGPRYVAGILGGHLTVQADGPQCFCGNVGCLEALIGTHGLQQMYHDLSTGGRPSILHDTLPTPLDLFQAAAAGDPLASDIVHMFTQRLGAGIVNMIHAYDPDIVILGGGFMRSFDQFLPRVQAYVDAHAWTIPRERVAIVPATLGDAAALVGIAELTRNSEYIL
jgi:glucokinase